MAWHGQEKQLGASPSPLLAPLGSARVPGQVGAQHWQHHIHSITKGCQTSRAGPKGPGQDTRRAGARERPGRRDGSSGLGGWAGVGPSHAVQQRRALILKWCSVLQHLCWSHWRIFFPQWPIPKSSENKGELKLEERGVGNWSDCIPWMPTGVPDTSVHSGHAQTIFQLPSSVQT